MAWLHNLLGLDLMETSDESDDEDEMMMLHHMMNQRRERIPKIIGFVEDIIPQQTGLEFRRDFRY